MNIPISQYFMLLILKFQRVVKYHTTLVKAKTPKGKVVPYLYNEDFRLAHHGGTVGASEVLHEVVDDDDAVIRAVHVTGVTIGQHDDNQHTVLTEVLVLGLCEGGNKDYVRTRSHVKRTIIFGQDFCCLCPCISTNHLYIFFISCFFLFFLGRGGGRFGYSMFEAAAEIKCDKI